MSEALGRLRQHGRLDVPVASAITDLAGLYYWAHPGVDLHLVTHRESIEEVRAIAPASRIVWANGMWSPDFLVPRDRADARRALDLPPDGPVIVVSGGGWAMGDLEGAAEAALRVDGATVVCLCGRMEEVRASPGRALRRREPPARAGLHRRDGRLAGGRATPSSTRPWA